MDGVPTPSQEEWHHHVMSKCIRRQYLMRALLTGSESVRQITSVCFEEDFLFYFGIAVAST